MTVQTRRQMMAQYSRTLHQGQALQNRMSKVGQTPQCQGLGLHRRTRELALVPHQKQHQKQALVLLQTRAPELPQSSVQGQTKEPASTARTAAGLPMAQERPH